MNSHEFHFYSHEILTTSQNRCLLHLLAIFYLNTSKIRKTRKIHGIFSVNPHSVFLKYFFCKIMMKLCIQVQVFVSFKNANGCVCRRLVGCSSYIIQAKSMRRIRDACADSIEVNHTKTLKTKREAKKNRSRDGKMPDTKILIRPALTYRHLIPDISVFNELYWCQLFHNAHHFVHSLLLLHLSLYAVRFFHVSFFFCSEKKLFDYSELLHTAYV